MKELKDGEYEKLVEYCNHNKLDLETYIDTDEWIVIVFKKRSNFEFTSYEYHIRLRQSVYYSLTNRDEFEPYLLKIIRKMMNKHAENDQA